MNDRDSTRARRYLLGGASDQECAGLELEYFSNEGAVDGVAAAEEDLIEDYLADRLGADEASQFERVYLATPQHRTRVATIRRLMAEASKPAREAVPIDVRPRSVARTPRSGNLQWLLLAAAAVLAVGVAWMLRQPTGGRPVLVENRPPVVSPAPDAPTKPPGDAPPAPARIFALSISPITVRSAAEGPSLVIPPGTDIVALKLEGEAAAPARGPARVVIRSVSGSEIWRGAAAAGDPAVGVVARADVPAARLQPEDYIVELFGTDAAGVQRERYRYYLRVRSR